MIWFLFVFMLMLGIGGILLLVVGSLCGMIVGSTVGAVRRRRHALEADKDRETYRGLTRGGCLGAIVGMALAGLLIFVIWNYMLVVRS